MDIKFIYKIFIQKDQINIYTHISVIERGHRGLVDNVAQTQTHLQLFKGDTPYIYIH